MDNLDPIVNQLVAAKKARRAHLAALPYPEKVRIVVQLQQMIAPILNARGRDVKPWVIPPGP